MPLKSLHTTINTLSEDTLVPDWNGRLGAFLASGDFNGATVKLQHKIGAEWVDVGIDTTLSSSGGGQFITPQANLRVSVSGGNGSPSVTVIVKPLVI